MTAQPHQIEFSTKRVTLFAWARSQWLDSFSRLEIAVLRCGAQVGLQPQARGTPLCQRLSDLKAQAPNLCSDATQKKLSELVRECEAFLPRRATMVHAVMRIRRRTSGD